MSKENPARDLVHDLMRAYSEADRFGMRGAGCISRHYLTAIEALGNVWQTTYALHRLRIAFAMNIDLMAEIIVGPCNPNNGTTERLHFQTTTAIREATIKESPNESDH